MRKTSGACEIEPTLYTILGHNNRLKVRGAGALESQQVVVGLKNFFLLQSGVRCRWGKKCIVAAVAAALQEARDDIPSRFHWMCCHS
jgi:hypothetical protein